MSPTLTAAVSTAAALVFLTLLGYAPAVLLLPARLRPWFWVAAPVTGLAVAAVGLGWLVLLLPGGLAGELAVALALLAAAAVTAAGHRPPAGQALGQQAAVGALVLLAAAIALAPLVERPDLISIGPNWDVEIYLPMAAYLQDAPLGLGLQHPAGFAFPGPPNPLLWRVNFFDPRWSGLTFQEVHAAIDALLGLAPHASFAGLLAAMAALTPPAVFLLARSLRLAAAPALLAAGLTAAGAPIYYVVYWSFGQQASALPLVPLATAGLVAALTTRDTHGRMFAALGAASLFASYVPAVPAYGVAAVLCAAVAGWAAPRLVAGRVLAVAAFTAALAPWALVRCLVRGWHFFDERGVGGLTVGPDVRDFPPLGWGFGLYPTPEGGLAGLLPKEASGLAEMAVRVLLLVVIALGMLAWRRREPLLATLALTPAVVLLPLRFLAPYPYGYLKTMPFVAPLLLIALAAGGAALWAYAGRGRPLVRTLVGAAAVVLVGVNAYSAAGQVVQIRSNSPMAFRSLEGLAAAVPEGASVYLSGHRDMWGPKGGAVAYGLRHAELYGYLPTGFSSFYRVDEAGRYAYALFSENEQPWRELLGGQTPVWAGMGLRLYRVPTGVLAYNDVGADAPPVVERTGGQGNAAGLRLTEWTDEGYIKFAGWSPPLLGTLSETTPPATRYPEVFRGNHWDGEVPDAVTAGQRVPQVLLTLASLRPQTTTVTVGDHQVSVEVPAGLSTHNLGSLSPGTRISVLDNGNQLPMWVRSLIVAETGVVSPATFADTVLVQYAARLGDGGVMLDALYHGPQLQAVVDIYSVSGAVHYGYWTARPERAANRTLRYRLDTLQQRLVTRRLEATSPIESWRGDDPDGDYRIYLFLYRDGKVVQQVPIATFTLQNRRAVAVTAERGNLYIG